MPLRVGRSEIRSITRRAANLQEAELPDDDEPEADQGLADICSISNDRATASVSVRQ